MTIPIRPDLILTESTRVTLTLPRMSVAVSADDVSDNITDEQRIEWIRALACGCKNDGTICKIRAAVNDPALDD